MSGVGDMLAKARPPDARRDRPTHPKGWEPGIAWRGTEGTVISDPTAERDPEWDRILQHFQFDPTQFAVVEPIEVRSWDAYAKDDATGEIVTKTLWYHKARVIRRRDDEARADIEDLIREVRSHKARKQPAPSGERALVVGLADVQIGKKGTEATVARFLAAIDAVVARAKTLRKLGIPVGALYAAQMADLVEATAGQYAMQTFEVELTRAEQVRLARRLWVKALKTWAPHFERIVVPVVPGNHGENRNASGKAYTSFQDNDDLEILVQVGEVLAENPDAYGHVSIVVPDDEMTVTLDVCGTIVAFAHGHQFPKKKNEFAWEWWDGQARGMKPAGDAAILLSAHRHHFTMQQRGVRTWLQCPTLDSGSEWYEHTTGEASAPGALTFVVGPDGWSDLAIL